MKVIKRNGSEVNFDVNKIVAAIAKANKAAHREELTREQKNACSHRGNALRAMREELVKRGVLER